MSKEIKSTLKEAREAIKNKDFKFAIKLCLEVLKSDNENYMALILIGAAYQDTDKALSVKYLRKALVNTNDPLIALQGLSNCAPNNELLEIYEKLLELTPEKYQELHSRIYLLSKNDEFRKSCIKLFEKETKLDENSERVNSALIKIGDICQQGNEFDEDLLEICEKSLEFSVRSKTVEDHLEKFKKYLKLLYKMKMIEKLAEKASDMSSIYQNQVYSLEWICKIFTENFENPIYKIKENLKSDIFIFVDNVLLLNKKSPLGLLSKAIIEFEANNLIVARSLLVQVNQIQPNWNICIKLLGKIYLRNKAFGLAEGIYRELNSEPIVLGKCLVEQGIDQKCAEAIQLLRGLDHLDKNGFAVLTKSLILTNQNFDEEIKKCDENDLILLQCLQLRIKENYHASLELLIKNPINNFDYYMELGRTYFLLANYNEAVMPFLQATKEEPFNSESFFWLGKLYLKINDETRSKKCFEKSLNINPNNKEAILSLSSIYRKNSEWDANLVLLQKAGNLHDAAWAWRHFGLHHLAQNNYMEAINGFRAALRKDPYDFASWEGLADSYFTRGSFSSALKVYQKTCELQPKNLYPKLQEANIYTVLGMYREAIVCFEKILKENSEYVPALKGIAEAHLEMCYSNLGQRLLGRSRDHAQKSINYLTEAIQLKPNLSCIWRLLGNVLDSIGNFPDSLSYLEIAGSLAGEKSKKVTIKSDKLFELASRCYCRAIKINSEDNLLWYQLAFSYYQRACKNIDEILKKEFLKLASESAKQAIKLNSTRWQNWNVLGVISATKSINNLALAQHCFIKSISLEDKSATSWTNLGVLYASQNNIKLANKAYGRAQQTDPSSINAWVGQAILAEVLGQGDEAMDLFRHCTQLGFNKESAVGYTHWVCSILENSDYLKDHKYRYAIENMHAVAVALDSMNWVCSHEDVNSSVESLCFLGYLNFRQGLWKNAIRAFKLAAEKACDKQKDVILTNLGYCLLKNNQIEDAIKVLNAVSEATFKSTIGLALALFKGKKYQESYSVYENALQWLAETDAEKSFILIAMSAMIYAFQGDKDAKTVLFQCSTRPSAPVEGLFSACALGILHKDSLLSELVLKELKPYENSPKHCHHIAFLTSQIYVQMNEPKKALLYLLSKVHCQPDLPLLRQVLANFLLLNFNNSQKHLKAASKVARSSIVLGIKNLKSMDASKSLAIASEAMKHVNKKERKLLAQKAVHLNPTCKEALSALKACSS